MRIITQKGDIKSCMSADYNYVFNTKTGDFARWGKTVEDDPKCGPIEIFDLEDSTVCNGIGSGPCRHCYKSNTKKGDNMTFETFKSIFDKMPRTLTQIAFGIGDIWSNPDLIKMFDYCRNNTVNPNVVPNLTINGYGLTDEWVATLAKYCGGIAVSVYDPKDVCYDAVEKLVNAGISQVNIHMLVSAETYDRCIEVINDAATDPRLKGLKAIVLLTLKPKGKRNTNTIIKDVSKYRHLIDLAFGQNINVGFDSCSAPTFLKAMKDHPQFERFSQMSESCESDRFSGYANVKGEYWHCSFTEGQPGWEPVDLMKVNSFEAEVWNSPQVKKFRDRLLCQNNDHIDGECYLCPVYDLYHADIGNGSKKVIPIMEAT